MEPATPDTTAELALLRQRLERIERRLDTLERTRGAPIEAPPDERSGALETADGDEGRATEWLPLLGRTLVIVGGGFVLRAVTEANIVAPSVGAALGVAYAVAWFVMADRAAARGAKAGAVWNGLAATVIGFPLVWEATVDFGFLSPLVAAGVTAAITAIALFVVWRGPLPALAGIVTSASVATLLALAFGTKLPVPFVVVLLLLGSASLWIGFSREWPWLSWLVSIPSSLLIALLTAILLIADAERAAQLIGAQALIALQLGLVIAYVGTFATRTIAARAEVRAAEVAQCVVVVVVGLGGAVAVTQTYPSGYLALGLVSAVLGATGYAVSFTLIDRAVRRTNFIFYSSLALTFAFVAAISLLPVRLFAVAFACAAVLMAAAGSWLGRATLSLHGAVYAIGAAVASGLVQLAFTSMTASAPLPDVRLGVGLFAALAAGIAYCAFPVASHGRTWGRVSRVPKLIVLIAALGGIAGVVVSLLGNALASSEPGAAPILAIIRTAVLAVAAIVLARLGRIERLVQASWLVYPVLIAGGAKFLFEDLRVGGPAALVASLALYGGALIIAPRLARTRH